MGKTMRTFIVLLAFVGCSYAQTYKTVTADTNNVIRTNFTLNGSQISGSFSMSNVTGLQTALDSKLNTNGSADSLTNFPSLVLTTNSSATAFPLALLRTNGDGSGLTNLPNANLSNAIGVLPISNGGTQATNASLAISNLLPSYTGNSNRILALNSNATSLQWITNTSGGSGGTVDLSTTNATGILPPSKGGTGVNNIAGTNTSIYNVDNGLRIGVNTTNNNQGVALGTGASATASFTHAGTSIGLNATASFSGVAIGRTASSSGGSAVGYGASAIGEGGSLGLSATTSNGGSAGGNTSSENGGAIGYNAKSSNSSFAGGHNANAFGQTNVQLLPGTNTVASSIQLLSAGSVDTTEWGYLANASTRGGYAMTNTAAISTNRTFVSYDGTNYVTNSVTISNGIITGWTQ